MTRAEYLALRRKYDPDARAGAEAKPTTVPNERSADMATKAKTDEQVEEIVQKDFKKAVQIYRHDIKPAQTKVGEFGQEQSTAFKAIKKDCHIQPQAAKMAFKIAEMEEAHRDDLLICLNGLFKELGITMPRDLVTIAEGTEGGDVIPAGDRKPVKLATLDGEHADEFEEADEAELAGQKNRPSAEAAQADADRAAEDAALTEG